MPRKKKQVEESDTEGQTVKDVTLSVRELVPIAELLNNEATILGERYEGKLPRNAEFSPVFLEMATRLVSAGLTENDLAYILGTTVARIKYWKRNNPLFKKACTDGKKLAMSYLIAQGLRAAAGYNTLEKNIKIKRKFVGDELVEYPAEISEFHKHVQPDASLLMFMLCNMSRQLKDEMPWTSQHKIEVEENKNVNIKISGKVASEQIDRLAGAFRPDEIIEAEIVKPNEIEGKTENVSKD